LLTSICQQFRQQRYEVCQKSAKIRSGDWIRTSDFLLPKQGKSKEAIDLLVSVIKKDSGSALTHCYLAYALGLSGDLHKALREFSVAETLGRNENRIRLLRAEVYQRHGKMKEAEADQRRTKDLRLRR